MTSRTTMTRNERYILKLNLIMMAIAAVTLFFKAA